MDREVLFLIIDSRKPDVREEAVFFAIRGLRHDGHLYLKSLYALGVRQFVVEQVPDDVQSFSEANILLVPSSVLALQDIVAYQRRTFPLTVIGITGSNGKTITKEWLAQMLSQDKVVVKNPGSYNSQVGVPLSVWQIQSYHQYGIFEAGISKPGEMELLEKVIQPTLGIFTNIGSAHDEGFENQNDKIREKLKLFKDVKKLIYCRDQSAIHGQVQQLNIPSFTWGEHDADVVIKAYGGLLLVTYQGHQQSLSFQYTDHAAIENVSHCITMLLHLNYSFDFIQQALQALRPVSMRLELKEGINHCMVIDDTYNNDLAGLEISLQFLMHQHQRSKKSLILSDILESGLAPEDWVQQVAQMVKKNAVHRFIGIGESLSRYRELFPSTASFYANVKAFESEFAWEEFQDEVILVKGARLFQLETIVKRLQRRVHGTVMEIDLGAMIHNLNFFRSRLKPTTKLMVMVKAFAYGSGSNEVANLLQYHRVDYLGVAYADEGIDLRKNNITLPIMVMNPSEESFESLIRYNLEPEVYSFKIFHSLIRFLQGKSCTIHLKLDTGMHRLGFEPNDIDELILLLKANKNIHVASVFTHLAGADESAHDLFSRKQADTFIKEAQTITDAIGYKPLYHVLNSPGILRLPEFQFDMVRLGIGLYGVDPTEKGDAALRPVASLKTIVSQIKHIEAGETVGYGRHGVATHPMTLATIAIGYADGFSRAFSRGVGKVMISGKRAPVVGNVCMDMTMIDVTDIPVKEGDEVIIFGNGLPINEVAQVIHTIPYEILTNTSERVKRVFVSEGM